VYAEQPNPAGSFVWVPSFPAANTTRPFLENYSPVQAFPQAQPQVQQISEALPFVPYSVFGANAPIPRVLPNVPASMVQTPATSPQNDPLTKMSDVASSIHQLEDEEVTTEEYD